MEGALILVRLVAFAAGAALLGAPLFALYSGALPSRLKSLIVATGAASALSAGAALVIQTGQMAGDPMAGLDLPTLRDMVTSDPFGISVLFRLAAGLLAVVIGLTLPGRRPLWALSAGLGAVCLGALPWSGHGAADEGVRGQIHLLADIAHLWAAGVWLGALAAFLTLLAPRPRDTVAASALHRALERFSGVGSLAVAVIVASGLVNSWYLVGPDHLDGLISRLWGQLLLVKVAVFALMLGLAWANRFRLTPALGAALPGRPDVALTDLRRSIILESALGLGVLALVAMLGTQPSPASM